MSTKAGVWIDHKQAIVVLLTDGGHEMKKIPLDIGKPAAKGAKVKHSYRPRDFIAEDTQKRKVENHRKDFFNNVLAGIKGVDALLIFGPGEAKGEFCKYIKSKKIRGVVLETEAADKITSRQIAAKVVAHFTKAPALKPVATKKAAKVKRAKATSKAS